MQDHKSEQAGMPPGRSSSPPAFRESGGQRSDRRWKASDQLSFAAKRHTQDQLMEDLHDLLSVEVHSTERSLMLCSSARDDLGRDRLGRDGLGQQGSGGGAV